MEAGDRLVIFEARRVGEHRWSGRRPGSGHLSVLEDSFIRSVLYTADMSVRDVCVLSGCLLAPFPLHLVSPQEAPAGVGGHTQNPL